MRHIVLFTATVMIGNERVELMLFDTTGQVMIAALASVHSALFSPLLLVSELSRSHFRIASYIGARLGSVSAWIILVRGVYYVLLSTITQSRPSNDHRSSSWNQPPIPLPSIFSGAWPLSSPVERLSWWSGLETPHSTRLRQRRGVPRRPAGQWSTWPAGASSFSDCRSAVQQVGWRGDLPPATWSHLSVAGVMFWLLKRGLTSIYFECGDVGTSVRAGPNHSRNSLPFVYVTNFLHFPLTDNAVSAAVVITKQVHPPVHPGMPRE